MLCFGKMGAGVLAAIFFIAAGGCTPSDTSAAADEEKEPHFVEGNNRFNNLDYPGAIEAYRESLEVNPRSARAHYRLAQLFDTKQPDPAAAIFHYQEYLRLDPQAENIEVIRQRVAACKQQLAADVMTIPTAPAAIRQIETLTETNRALQLQIAQLRDAVKKWSGYAASLQAAQTIPATPGNNFSAPPPVGPPAHNLSAAPPAPARTCVVKPAETLAAIARKNGVSLAALEAANPGVNPKKLRAGQTLNLPGLP